jgi:hypothetical protein
MSNAAFPTQPRSDAHLGAPPERDPADPRIVRAEERLAMLRELAELGMSMTRAFARRALESPPTDPDDAPAPAPAPSAMAGAREASRAIPGPRHDPAESFARLSRAVRLTLAFEVKTEDQLANLRAGGKERPAKDRRRAAAVRDAGDDDYDYEYDDDDHDDDEDDGLLLPPAKDYPSAQRNQIRDRVFEVINSEITDVYKAHEVLDDLHDRLWEGERYDDFVFRPIREAVAAICDDLGLNPDWSRWTDDGWTPRTSGPNYVWHRMWAPGASRPEKRRRQ